MTGQVLGPQNPGVVGQPSVGIAPGIAIDEQSGGGNAVLRLGGEKRKFLRVFEEMKQVGVRAAELVFAVHAERVVPDDPTADVEAEFLRLDLQLGGVFVA